MTGETIPPDMRDFIYRYFDSVAQLECALLLRRSPDAAFTADDAARSLYVQHAEAAGLLARLVADGFAAERDGAYKFEVRDADQRGLMDRLAELYRRQLVPVSKLIHDKPRGARAFADAFKLRKDG